jgi:hypothetical protein
MMTVGKGTRPGGKNERNRLQKLISDHSVQNIFSRRMKDLDLHRNGNNIQARPYDAFRLI